MSRFTNNRVQQAAGSFLKPSAQRDIEGPEGCRGAVFTKGVTLHGALSVQYKFGGVLQVLWGWEGVKTQREGFWIFLQLIDFSLCKGSE